MTIFEALATIKDGDNKAKGTAFEKMIRRFLIADPYYSKVYDKVWMWDDFPAKDAFGSIDLGIDLVAHRADGRYTSIQCKFYGEKTVIDKQAVDSFVVNSLHTFPDPLDPAHPTVSFAELLWVSTSQHWGPNAEQAFQNLGDREVHKIYTSDLADSQVDWADILNGKAMRPEPPKPRDYQQEVVSKAMRHFLSDGAERGTLVMACGTGKTLTSLFTMQEFCRRMKESGDSDPRTLLFLAPSIALVSQTLRSWVGATSLDMGALCVCSDPKAGVTQDPTADADDFMQENLSDLPVASCTDPERVASEITRLRACKEVTVVFSTYQSIKVVHDSIEVLRAQGSDFTAFDFAICDEAHRTSTALMSGKTTIDVMSAFTRIHDAEYVPATHRLYMTATPKIYKDADKKKAEGFKDLLFSMDDEKTYGKVFHTLSFGTAVEKGLLTDYKVLVLTVSPGHVSNEFLNALKAQEDAADAAQAEAMRHVTPEMTAMMLGTLAALSKKVLSPGKDDFFAAEDDEPGMPRLPLRSCIAFCDNVMRTKKTRGGKYVIDETAAAFMRIADTYRQKMAEAADVSADDQQYLDTLAPVRAASVSGAMNMALREEQLQILRQTTDGETHIVCNVNCLSEGVDVPALDAIAFLAAKSSPITLIQSVGRVMRKFKGKKFGYVIIPVVVPMNVEADKELDKNERYKLVWDVLNALRSHDERLAAELSAGTYRHVEVVMPYKPGDDIHPHPRPDMPNFTLPLDFTDKLYARMVEKVGDRFYWTRWSKRVGDVAQNFEARINELYDTGIHRQEMDDFVAQLRESLNPTIDERQATTFLAQHLVTHPVFDALFEGYNFAENNPVSRSMEKMIALLEDEAFARDREVLSDFQSNVRQVCGALDSHEKKQEMIRTLYEQFFKTAFPRVTEQLGIVYTPVPCVDFIIRSVDDILRRDFAKPQGIATPGVRCLDPFAGTGTFTARALNFLAHTQMVSDDDLRRAYNGGLFCNEIVLLSYYVADVNIEATFNAIMDHRHPHASAYQSYDGITLSDTFALTESRGRLTFEGEMGQNALLAAQEIEKPLTVIWGNPPYSVGQKSANDNAQNLSYPALEKRIADTYAAQTTATSAKALYDSYIKAFRWASDRIAEQGDRGGIVAFISNGAWIDGNSQEGMRRCLESEWDDIYIYHLRGNQRTSGELSRAEGGKIFGSGSRTPIAITILVRRPGERSTDAHANIHFVDVGSYLTREQKLERLSQCGSVLSDIYAQSSTIITPNAKADWINQRDGSFELMTPMAPDKKFDSMSQSFFSVNSLGMATARDPFMYSFSKEKLEQTVKTSIDFYNNELNRYLESDKSADLKNFVNYDPKKIVWGELLLRIKREQRLEFDEKNLCTAMYRPFAVQNFYYDKPLIQRTYQQTKLFPTPHHPNLLIGTSGLGGTKNFSCTISDVIPDLNCLDAGTQCYPLWYYETAEEYIRSHTSATAEQPTLPGLDSSAADLTPESLAALGFDQHGLRRRSAITDWMLSTMAQRTQSSAANMAQLRRSFGPGLGMLAPDFASTNPDYEITDADLAREVIFFFVYGALHDPTWRQTFAPDLRKSLPRLPLPESFDALAATARRGHRLALLHLYAASARCADIVEPTLPSIPGLAFRDASGQEVHLPISDLRVTKMRFPSKTQRDTIIISDTLSLTGIPPEAYAYVVNGKSAIEWIMERVALTTDKASGIVNDPNLWAAEHNEPDFAARLLLRVVKVSVASGE